MAVRHIARRAETEGFIQLIRAGEYRQALTEIVGSRLGHDLGEYCFAMLGEQELAEQALIDTWVALYSAMPQLDNTSLRPWLFEQARAHCTRALTPIPTPSESEPAKAHGPSPADDPRTRLRGRLWELQPDERDAVLLRYLARLSYADIAVMCGVEVGDARRKAGKALLRLRQAELEFASGPLFSTPAPAPPSSNDQRKAGR